MRVMEFDSLLDFSLHLVTTEVAIVKASHTALGKAAQLIERDVKGQIGEYQQAVGTFPAWAPLAESTESEKARQGYPTDAPLLRTGELRDSVSHAVDGGEAVIGSTSEVAVYHELGTSKMPPRPMFGPAVVKQREAIQKLIGAVAFGGVLLGEKVETGDYFIE